MTGWIAGNMAWASLAMLGVLLLRRPFARLFGAAAAYALWLVPALRLALPPLPSFAPDIPVTVPPRTLILFVGDAAAPLPPDGGPGQWVPMLLALWALGAAAFLAWQWLGYRKFLGEIAVDMREVGEYRGLVLVESAAVEGPVALGLVARRIVLPADFAARYSPEEQRLALDHERIHHRRGDIWWNHVGLAILALNWFNPIAWIAFRAFRADQELACDAAVAAAASPQARHDYARALIKSASRPGLIAACPLNHADQLKRRLKMMKNHRASRARMLAGAAAIAALGGLSLALGTPGFAQAEPPAAPRPPAHADGEARTVERTVTETTDDGGGRHRIVIRTERTGDDAHPAAHGARAAHDGQTERVIVMHAPGSGGGGDHAAGAHGDGQVQTFTLHRDGEPGGHGDGQVQTFTLHRVPGGDDHAAVMVDGCQNGQRDEVNQGSGGQQTRIILCSRGADATPAQRAERLQHVRDRMAADSDLSAEQRASVLAAIDRQIAALRGQH